MFGAAFLLVRMPWIKLHHFHPENLEFIAFLRSFFIYGGGMSIKAMKKTRQQMAHAAKWHAHQLKNCHNTHSLIHPFVNRTEKKHERIIFCAAPLRFITIFWMLSCTLPWTQLLCAYACIFKFVFEMKSLSRHAKEWIAVHTANVKKVTAHKWAKRTEHQS